MLCHIKIISQIALWEEFVFYFISLNWRTQHENNKTYKAANNENYMRQVKAGHEWECFLQL